MTALCRGAVVWVDLDPTRGREQRGQRPAVVICNDDYLRVVPDLAIVLPLTTTDRNWPHHVLASGPSTGLPKPSFAMTEQPRTISRARISRQSGVVDGSTLAAIDSWLQDFLGAP